LLKSPGRIAVTDFNNLANNTQHILLACERLSENQIPISRQIDDPTER
jgi:hypothetical protein